MKTRIILLVGAVGALLAGLWLARPAVARWQAQRRTFAQAQAFWERFRTTNSTWLDPQPPSISYELVLQRKERDFAAGTEYWADTSVLRTWCTPEKNLRFVEEHLDRPATYYHVSEQRYCHGRGGRVSLKPSAQNRQLGTDMWLAGRTGAGVLTPLHLIAAWGLPPSAAVQTRSDGTILFVVTNLSGAGRGWRRDFGVYPAYGMHPASFASCTEHSPHRLEVQVNATNLLPSGLEETDHLGRTQARIVFEEPWLEVDGRPVPRIIRCELPAQKFSLRYEFGLEQGAWLLRECVRTVASAYSLCRRSYARALKTGPLADDLFPGPADLEIPEHSVTSLGPGDRLLSVPVGDGLSLEAKLTLPLETTGPVPVVFFLPGSGPWTFDRPVVYPDFEHLEEMPPPLKVYNYCDFFARELASRRIGFFRMNKRGCGIVRDEGGYPREIVNRSLFSKATPTVLLADYRAALRILRRQPGVDADRILLLGASEGTRLAPRLALAQPAGVIALALFGYSEHNTRDTILWQNTVGPWRNITKIFDANNDQVVTRQEYDEVVRVKGKIVAEMLPFENLDRNRDGIVTPAEMNHRALADAILRAVRERDDDYLYDHVLCLSSAGLLEEWQAPPTHQALLRLNLPIGIFHGENDGACRVEGAREAASAFVKAGKTNLTLRVYPKTDHDLNWASFLKTGQIPAPYTDLFGFIAVQAGSGVKGLQDQ